MKIAFNGLSATHLSARHVLRGHIQEIAAATPQRHLLLHHVANKDLAESLQGAVNTLECPAYTRHWSTRRLWERTQLSRLLKNEKVDILFSPAGISIPDLKIPQFVLTQNPWCFVSSIHTHPSDHVKAKLQQRAYRRAQKEAAVMLYNSKYMQELYNSNAGQSAKHSLILHQGIDETTFIAAKHPLGSTQRKQSILVVSAMAHHKHIQDVIGALSLLRHRGLSVTLDLVGPWPDPDYRRFIEQRIAKQQLENAVTITGKVDQTTLHEYYRTARVFCLLSQCESFGIPAIEAQAFGTPTVVADCGAMPEIAGPGGEVVPSGNAQAAAEALLPLLISSDQWHMASERARLNAKRFHWKQCTAPLVSLLESIQADQSNAIIHKYHATE